MTDKSIVIDSIAASSEQTELPEIPVEICQCKKCRIKRFRVKQSLGYLPKKPEARITGKHEYIRLDDVNDSYWTRVKHKYQPDPVVDFGTCSDCGLKTSREDIENGYGEFCKIFTTPSQLDTKLTSLKTEGRKALSTTKEWGGWTIKMMALQT